MLKGKNALITGCRRGIGRAAAECFARNGANVWACARREDADFSADMAALARKYGVWIKPVCFDLNDEDAMKEGVRRVLLEKLPVDILVNNAGIADGGTLLTTPVSRMRAVYEVNVFAQVLLMQHIAKAMARRRSGAIVNVASVGGMEANPGYLAYGSSKAALIWLTKSVSRELAPLGIRVNAVAPGATRTDMGGIRSEEELEKVVARTPLRRTAQPHEVARAILFLASEQASFTTGHVLCVDGGRV